MTVDPTTNFSRKNAFEKQTKGNQQKTSLITPTWMQQDKNRDEEKLKMFKGRPMYYSNARCERNRVILADTMNPPKSIFNIGTMRHNVLTATEAKTITRNMADDTL